MHANNTSTAIWGLMSSSPLPCPVQNQVAWCSCQALRCQVVKVCLPLKFETTIIDSKMCAVPWVFLVRGSTQLAGKKIYIYTQRCHSWQQPSCVGVAQFRWLGKAKTRSSSAGLAKLASNFCLNKHTVSKYAKEPKHSETQKHNDTPLLTMDRWSRGCD